MGWLAPDPSEWAILVFARHAHEARTLAYRAMQNMTDLTPTEVFLDTRVRWLRDEEHGYLRAAALSEDSHVVDDPPYCRRCELWGTGPIDNKGVCERCREEERDG